MCPHFLQWCRLGPRVKYELVSGKKLVQKALLQKEADPSGCHKSLEIASATTWSCTACSVSRADLWASAPLAATAADEEEDEAEDGPEKGWYMAPLAGLTGLAVSCDMYKVGS